MNIQTIENNAVAGIMRALSVAFAELDAEYLASSQVWAKGRVEALREFEASDERKELSAIRDSHALYARRFRIAGGKTWFNVFYGRNAAMIEEFIVKNCARVVASRNASISAKLIKSGVSRVMSSEYGRTSDGFNGVFVVATDAGQKRVEIQTIVAGGYAIQCLHQRTLIRVSAVGGL